MEREFSIKIFDVDDPGATTILEIAQSDSIKLKWSGGDEKTKNIIGSSLGVNIKVPNQSEAALLHLYTHSDRKYRVELFDEDATSVIWQGFLLPDQYSEPFTNNNPFINFTASCGLGTLKGYYLPDEFYSKEQSIVQIISACLKLTGLDANLFFSPAIVNTTSLNWNAIYLDTSLFKTSKGKKDKAYKILETILFNLCCTVYQDSGDFYVVGYNKRIINGNTFQKYNANGSFIEEVTVERSATKATAFGIPNITVFTPVKRVEVTTDNEAIISPEALYKETSDGYVDLNNLNLTVFSRAWKANGGYSAYYFTLNSNVHIAPTQDTEDTTRFISLKQRPYIQKGKKFELVFAMELLYDFTITTADNESFSSNGDWHDLLKYEVLINDTVILSNGSGVDYRINFDSSRKAKVELEFIAEANGYLDIKFYEPSFNYLAAKASAFKFENIQYKEIAADDAEFFVNEISEEFTLVEDPELDVTDNIGNYKNVLRLAKLNDFGDTNYTHDFSVQYNFNASSKAYCQVLLREAVLMKDNIDFIEVQQGGSGAFVAVPDVEIIYNYFSGEQFVFTYDHATLGFEIVPADVVRIQVKNITHPPVDRDTWQQWSDDVYRINTKRYGAIVADIYENLFKSNHFKLEGTFNGLFSISQLIDFKYSGNRIYYPLNVEWNLTRGETTGLFCEAFYGVPIVNNIPPTVYAGDDSTVPDGDTTASLLATANDPDGFIVSQVWTLISGSATIDNPTELATTLSNLVGNSWTFEITVTDNGGLSATDQVTLTRLEDYEFVKQNIQFENTVDAESQNIVLEDKLNTSPVLPNDVVLRLKHSLRLEVNNHDDGGNSTVLFEVRKNGSVAYTKSLSSTNIENFTFDLLYTNTDDVRYYLDSESNSASGEGHTDGAINCKINEVVFESGTGQITNLPVVFSINTQAQG